MDLTQPSWWAFVTSWPAFALALVSLGWTWVQSRRLDREIRDSKAVEKRALELIHDDLHEREIQNYVFGEDRLRDRAVFLAREWGAVTVEWNGSVVTVRSVWGSVARGSLLP